MHFDKKTLRNIFLLVVAGILLYWVLHETAQFNTMIKLVGGILSPFITGAVLAFIINVPMRSIENKIKFIKKPNAKRVFSLIVTLILSLVVLSVIFWLLIPQVIETFQSLVPKLYSFILNTGNQISSFLNQNPQLMEWITNNTDLESMDWASLAQKAITLIGNSVSAILGRAFNAIGSMTSAIMDLFISFVFAIYCLFQKELLARQGRKLIYAFLPEKFCDKTIEVLRLSNGVFSNFLSGQCLEVCILGVMFAVSMAIFRMPYIPLVSVLVAVTAFVPIVGAWIGCAFGAFFMLVNDPMQAVWFVVMFLVIQQIENNMIYPRVVGTSIGLNGMWVLVAVAVGGELMGVIGMLLMIPLTSVLYTLIREYTNTKIDIKKIDPDKLMYHPPELHSNFKENRNKVRAKRQLRRFIRKQIKKVSSTDKNDAENVQEE